MKGLTLVAFVVSLVVASIGPMILVGAYQGEPITAHLAMTTPTIDGRWTVENEWNDTSEVPLQVLDGSGTAYLRVKHDGSYLYVLVDFVTDSTAQEEDFSGIAIDTKHDGGTAPQEDDFAFLVRWNSPTLRAAAIGWGTGSAWGPWQSALPSGFKGSSSTNAANDPYTDSPHLIYEFRIPKTALSSSEVGFYTIAFDREVNKLFWPPAPFEVPDQWGELEFSSVPIPEFPSATPILVAVLLAGIVLFKRKRICQRK